MNEDLSNLFSKFNINKDSISPEMIDNLMNMLHNTNVEDSTGSEETNNTTTNNIDFETILKMKSMMDKMNNKNDPRYNLLLSLKPYLKESRKEKLDQYIGLLKASQVLEVFPFLGGDNKNANK